MLEAIDETTQARTNKFEPFVGSAISGFSVGALVDFTGAGAAGVELAVAGSVSPL